MPSTPNVTKLICLFHTQEQANEALSDLRDLGLSSNAITVFGQGGSSANTEQSISALQELGLPASDMQMLSGGLNSGGTIIMVAAPSEFAGETESIFEKHRAAKVDEKVRQDIAPAAASAVAPAATAMANGAVIPIVEEELTVGKRQVERGGVRVYSRVVETPVEESIVLREEHAKVERKTVNRAVTAADVEALRVQSVEVTEMEEVPVVSKSARVVEEVLVGKESSERTEKVTDSVRKTQVDVETLAADVKGKRTPPTR